jgi:hypothetical protein
MSTAGQQVPDWMVAAVSSLLGYYTGKTVATRQKG